MSLRGARPGALFDVLARIPGREHELPAIAARLDGEAFVQRCARHGVSGWVAEAFERSGAKLPGEAQRRLEAAAREQVALGMRHRRSVEAVLKALAAQRLVPIMLKGLGLAERLYAQPLARPSSDVDVLVLPEELPTVRAALATLALTERADDALEDPFEEHHHLAFDGPAGLVEVHFRLFMGFGGAVFDDAGLRSRAVPGTLRGQPVRYLAPEDEFLYLAVHAANHAFLRASWLIDLERALTAWPRLDWATMGERARAAGFARAFAVTLGVVERCLELRLPAGAHALAHESLLDRALFSRDALASAALAEGKVSGFVERVVLVDDPKRALRHAVQGAVRWVRRSARSLAPDGHEKRRH